MKKIGILGTGSWGTALGIMLAKSGHEITMWAAHPEKAEFLSIERKHPNLPEAIIPDSVHFSAQISDACREMDIIVFAVASVYIRDVTNKAAPFISDGQILVDVAKGLEKSTFLTMTEVIEQELLLSDCHAKVSIVALSGPTHAEEVSRDMLSCITAASKDEEAAKLIQSVFTSSCMRVYTNNDIRGVELCGALKNVIALAAGISDGIGNGDNAKAAILTRGMAEITRLGLSEGCNIETFYGLAGIGDLIVTATSRHSRNNRAGYYIGSGLSPAEAIEKVGMVVEGINALPAALELSRKNGIEMPIVEAIDEVINHGADCMETVIKLMNREAKIENHSAYM